jgi:sodium-dependent dicarboxylate transporter 2/3/5
MAERMHDGRGTKVDQPDPERPEPAEPMRRQTYRTLDEQQGKLTEAEERFERGRRTIGLFLGPVLFLLLLVLPLGLDGKQQALAAVLGLVVTWWITEAIPIPVTGVVGSACA